MKKWYSLPAIGPKTYAVYAFLGHGFLSILLRNLEWPNFFPSWSANGVGYSHELLSGVIAFILIMTSVVLYSRSGIQELTLREKIGSIGFLFGFLMIPVARFLALASYSNGFATDPHTMPGYVIHLEHLQETLTSVIIAAVIPLVVYMVLLRDNPTSPQEDPTLSGQS